MSTPALTVAVVTHSLDDLIEYPKGPAVILTGSKEAVRAAAAHLFDQVTLIAVVPGAGK